MEALLNNGWVVGIVGGIFSGLIVTWLTRTIFSKKDQRELAINIATANREILYAIRPEISEGTLPTVEIIEALKSATARKYKLKPERLYGISQIVEELIKEIMDSSFISSATKKEYCDSLIQLIPIQTETDEAQAENREAFIAKVEYKEKMTALLSLTLGTIAALATMVSVVKNTMPSTTLVGKLLISVMPMILVVGSMVMVLTAIQVYFKLRQKRIRAEYGIKIESDDSEDKNNNTH